MRVSSGAVSHSRITPKAVSVAVAAEITTFRSGEERPDQKSALSRNFYALGRCETVNPRPHKSVTFATLLLNFKAALN